MHADGLEKGDRDYSSLHVERHLIIVLFKSIRSPKRLLTSRWSGAAIGKRGMRCFM